MGDDHNLRSIDGMEVLGEVGRGQFGVVYRALREGRPYAVKVLKTPAGVEAERDSVAFYREAGVLSRVRDEGICRIWHVGHVQARPYLVMDFLAGGSLSQRLAAGPLAPDEVVRVGKVLASALDAVHRAGIVHRDLKPENVMFDERGEPRLVDFGLAGGAALPDLGAAGTLRYSAPEVLRATGRVDGRADLYSLGVVLFECATGRPPFTSVDAAQLTRDHASAPVPDVCKLNPQVPAPLGAVIHQLLAKDVDERPQTGAALARELDRLHGDARPKAEGTARNEREVRAGDLPLVGRDVELKRLLGALESARAGRGSFVVIEGLPGAGKTRLVRELVAVAQQQGLTLLEAKCAADDPRPYSPLRTALEQLAAPARLRTLSLDARAKLTEKIVAAAADYAPMIRSFAPALVGVLEEGQGFAGGQEQFVEVLAIVITRLAEHLGGLVIFLDDIHNLDDASAEVLSRVSRRVGQVPLLVVATSRNNRESQARLQSYTKSNQVSFAHDLRLAALSGAAVEQLTRSYLGGTEVGDDLLQLIVTRSEGNPFATRELLQALLDHGLLRLSWGRFTLDREGLEKVRLPHDLLDLVLQRIDTLGSKTLELLTHASFLGPTFEIGTLAAVVQGRPEALMPALDEALRANLLEPRSGGGLAFVHDRIREALHKTTPAARAAELHQRIAETLDGLEGAALAPQAMYAIAAHYAAGLPSRTPERALEAGVAAGLEALDAYADQKAYDFLAWSVDFARTTGLTVAPSLYESLASVCMRTGKVPEAKQHYKALLELSKEPVVLSKAHTELTRIALYEEHHTGQMEELGVAFDILGETIPGNRLGPWLGTVSALGKVSLTSPERATPARLERAERAKVDALISLYDFALIVGFFLSDDAVFVQSIVRMLRLALKLGPSRALVRALGAYSTLMAVLGRSKASAKHVALAAQLAQRIGDPIAEASALRYRVLSLMFQGEEPRRTVRLASELLSTRAAWFDAWEFENLCSVHDQIALPQGHAYEVVRWSTASIARLEENALTRRDQMLISFSRAHYACALILLGRRGEAMQPLAQVEEMLASRKNLPGYHRAYLITLVALARVWLGELPEAERLLLGQASAIPLIKRTPPLRDYFLVMAFLRLAQALESEAVQGSSGVDALEVAVTDLKKHAGWRQFRPHVLVLQGALQRLRKNPEAAKKLLTEAESMATDDDVPWALFELNRQRALLFQGEGDPVSAVRSARAAAAVAGEQGWERWAAALVARFPGSDVGGQGQAPVLASTYFLEGGTKLQSSARKKLEALLQVSLATTETLDPVEQSHRALAELIKVMHAERAFLFLNEEGAPFDSAVRGIGRSSQGEVLESLTGYSSTVVEKVRASRTALIVSGTEAGEVLGSQSALVHGLKSIMVAPLMVRDRMLGAVYLDTHVAHGAFGDEELELLTAISSHIALAFESARAARAQVESERIRHELAVTTTVQAMLLPKAKTSPGKVKVACEYKPATVSGGDWWYHETLPNGVTRVYVCDVTGHGVGAAMVTAAMAAGFHAWRRHHPEAPTPELMQWLHWSLNDVTHGEYGATFIATEIDPADGSVRWWSAGAPPSLLFEWEKGATLLTRGPSSPLGGEADLQIDHGSMAMPRDSVLVMFSDGATESIKRRGRALGVKGLIKLLQQVPKSSGADQLCRSVMDSLLEVRGAAAPADDITLVGVQVEPAPVEAS